MYVSETWLCYSSKDWSDSYWDIKILIVSIYKISQKTVSKAKSWFFRFSFANFFLLTILHLEYISGFLLPIFTILDLFNIYTEPGFCSTNWFNSWCFWPNHKCIANFGMPWIKMLLFRKNRSFNVFMSLSR